MRQFVLHAYVTGSPEETSRFLSSCNEAIEDVIAGDDTMTGLLSVEVTPWVEVTDEGDTATE